MAAKRESSGGARRKLMLSGDAKRQWRRASRMAKNERSCESQ
jgi:hypothetical protein